VPNVLNAALGLPLQVVSGYKGTADIRIAAESGEVAGFCTGWESFKSTWRSSLDSGNAFIAVQAVAKPHAELLKVPLATSYAKTEEAKKMIQVGAPRSGDISASLRSPAGHTQRTRADITQGVCGHHGRRRVFGGCQENEP
jgi:hypothetical protein